MLVLLAARTQSAGTVWVTVTEDPSRIMFFLITGFIVAFNVIRFIAVIEKCSARYRGEKHVVHTEDVACRWNAELPSLPGSIFF